MNRPGKWDLRLQRLLENRAARHELRVRHFFRDWSKDGGAYFTLTGIVDNVHESGPRLALTDKTRIPLADVVDIQSAASGLTARIFEQAVVRSPGGTGENIACPF